jgi:hypothetical protein
LTGALPSGISGDTNRYHPALAKSNRREAAGNGS